MVDQGYDLRHLVAAGSLVASFGETGHGVRVGWRWVGCSDVGLDHDVALPLLEREARRASVVSH